MPRRIGGGRKRRNWIASVRLGDPFLPLGDAAGGVTHPAAVRGGLTAVAQAVKALTSPAATRSAAIAAVKTGKAASVTADGRAAAIARAGDGVGDLYWSNVVLLLDMETGVDASAAFIDRSLSARTVTANGDAQVDTAVVKYGTRAALFDGTGDYLQCADTPDFNIGTGDFTVELWVNIAAIAVDQAIIALRLTADADTQYLYRRASTDPTNPNKLGLSDSTLTRAFSDSALPSTTWVHIAWVRASGVHTLFVAGVLQSATWSSGGAPAGAYDPTAIRIGLHPLGVQPLTGSVDEVRITNGVARYSATFTPPGSGFPQWAAGPAKSVAFGAASRGAVLAADATAKAITTAAETRAGVGGAAVAVQTTGVTTSAAAVAGGRSSNTAAKALTLGEAANGGLRAADTSTKAATSPATARAAPRADDAGTKRASAAVAASAGLRADDTGTKRASASAAASAGPRAEDASTKQASATAATAAGPRADAATTPSTPSGVTTSATASAGLRAAATGTAGGVAAPEPIGGGFAFRQPTRKQRTLREPARHVVTSASAGARLRGAASSQRAATAPAHAGLAAPSLSAQTLRTGWAQADQQLAAMRALAEYRFIASRRPHG